MIEIIPNWHPIFVHFAIGLLTVSALFHVIAAINSKSTNYYQFENVANWNLWLGTVLALVTIIAGWIAYNSVDHDTPSHLAMKDHRNWAMITAGVFLVLAIWSFVRARKSVPIGWMLAILVVVAAALLATTGWKGGELVYRHGLGVMSLPNKGEHDHASHDHGSHDHGDTAAESGHSHDSLDVSDEPKSMESDAAHEVGEVDHGHDSIDASGAVSENKEESTSTENKTKSSSDGHNHDHSDHTH